MCATKCYKIKTILATIINKNIIISTSSELTNVTLLPVIKKYQNSKRTLIAHILVINYEQICDFGDVRLDPWNERMASRLCLLLLQVSVAKEEGEGKSGGGKGEGYSWPPSFLMNHLLWWKGCITDGSIHLWHSVSLPFLRGSIIQLIVLHVVIQYILPEDRN